MDASDRGLCALWPARKEYLQLEFDADELQQIADFNGLTSDEFSINIRELMSAVFAAIVWASQWSQSGQVEQAHTRFWIDNTSAVAWANRRSSRNLFAQMLLRLIGFLEVRYNFYSSAAHISGAENVMADVGSRDTTELKKTLHTLSALLRAGALADTSRVQYRRSWDQWLRWCSFMDYTPWLGRDTVDANAAQLGAFAVYLWRYGMNRAGVGNTCTTICSKLCAVRWFHKNTVGYDPGANEGHAILLRGIRRLTDPVVKQQSEYLFIGRKHHRYALRLGDIVFRNEAGQHVSPRQAEVVGIRLSGAKNNQLDVMSCDFTAAQEIKGARAFATQPDQPALSTGFGSGIAAEEVADTLKQAASAMGLDARLYSTHSIRIGGATELMNSGADRLVIKLMGRWLSNAFEGYPTLSAKGSRGLARLMCRSTSS
ncbi:hypothetical protein F444_01690 [Phytophthora nicotianae P1976]|uniref:Tyr recombinase domain-containing protein n=1 Tax=Phytophthora nicotianae P1976 TaxID=1317066 RepID=A0A081AZR8_PHYNI|nr:hypothetical protein F444_01690 [Phytophthora nicotianae P1976]